MSSDRPRRTIVQKQAVDWDDKWDAFSAEETSDKGDGKMDCKAILYYAKDVTDTSQGYIQIFGETGSGHAEMNALDEFIRTICGSKSATLSTYCAAGALFIECTTKPCCCRCSAILGALSVRPSSSDTKKTKAPMGSTQWGGLSPTVRDVIATYLGTCSEDIGTTLAAWRR